MVKPKKKDKYARYKLASIPLLLCVLAYVLFSQPQDSEGAPDSSPTAVPTASTVATQQTHVAASPQSLPWPEAKLEFLNQSNPLANYRLAPSAANTQSYDNGPPEANPVSAGDPLQNMVRDLTGNQVKYVFRSNQRKLVMLGEQIFEKGEQLSDNVQLQDIEDHALILTRSRATSLPQLGDVID